MRQPRLGQQSPSRARMMQRWRRGRAGCHDCRKDGADRSIWRKD